MILHISLYNTITGYRLSQQQTKAASSEDRVQEDWEHLDSHLQTKQEHKLSFSSNEDLKKFILQPPGLEPSTFELRNKNAPLSNIGKAYSNLAQETFPYTALVLFQ